MSGLAALLAGHERPGVVHWASGMDVADVAHAVELAGWTFAHVDGWRATTKPEVLAALGATLDFPDHYGRNLDALADCIQDAGTDASGTVLLWDGWGTLAHADRRAFDVVVQVLRGRSEAEHAPPFAVLLRGDGPDLVGVPVLS